ncbi:MAG: hypothetical protein QF441_12635 [Bacteriovoracaceae bacterium]|jgi:hypothetical protein|nr:hypothetical protein [Halobacteriovoraceae bacterium]MDP7321451.1 hypothetical protein [Bacteriovoracaceae bacterium]
MFKAMSAIVALALSFNAFSEINLNSFKKRFSYVKNDQGEVSYVKMNLINNKWSISPYVNQIKEDVKREIERMRSKSYEQELEELYVHLEQGAHKSDEFVENIGTLRRSFDQLKTIDVDHFFNKIETKGVLSKFQKELKEALRLLDLSVIASTQDPRYFYKRNVTYEVLKRAINFAKDKFTSIPVLNLVSYVLVEVHEMVLEQRLFHQNMLLHYLQNVKEDKLGLTIAEADRIFSSIYESRISPINYWESNRAADNWARYGLNKFYAMVRMANNKFRRSTRSFDDVNKRYNFAFFEAIEDGQRVVKNLVNTKHSFSFQMATAYNYDKPNQVKRFRSLLNLGQLGLSFLPIPGWLKGQVESFLKSYYVDQKRLEGALVAYFDLQGNKQMSKNIKNQLINPYIIQ